MLSDDSFAENEEKPQPVQEGNGNNELTLIKEKHAKMHTQHEIPVVSSFSRVVK